jgi:hypothetical protein
MRLGIDLGDVTAFTGTEPSPFAIQNQDHPIQVAARKAAKDNYHLRTVGSDTMEDLLDRISGVYWDQAWGTYTGAYTAQAIGEDPTFKKVVRLVAPSGSPKATKTTPDDYIKPTPGATPVKFDSIAEALALVKQGLQTYSDVQQRQMAEILMRRQQAGQPNYKPEPKNGAWKTSTKVAIGAGIGLAALALLYVAARPRRSSSGGGAPRMKALPAPA